MRKFIKWWDGFIGWNLEALLLCCTSCFIVVITVLFFKIIIIDGLGLKKRQTRKNEDAAFKVEESQVLEDGSVKMTTSDGAVYILKISKEMNDNVN